MSRFILPSTKKIFQNTCKKNFLTFELEYNIIFFMATYNFTFTMTAHQTGTAGHYPIKAGNTTFSTTTTLFAKAGDTVNYIISEGDGSTVHYLDNTNPDPTASGTGTYPVMASGATWSHTLASSFTAVEWYYFGGTTQGSGRKYSNRVVTRRVAGAFTNSNGASVVQGGSITFTVSGTASLPAVSGSSNYLYIGIRKGGTMVHTNHTPAGMYWDSGNNQLGKVHTGDLSTVMTVGSNMTPGTDYSAHLYHYSPVTSAAFYDPLNELDSVTFTITAPDTTPAPFSLGADHTNVGVNTTVTTSSATITGIDAPADISVSGDGSPEYQIGNGGWTSSSQQNAVSSGQSVTMRFTASSSAGTAHTATLTVGGVSDSVTATTASASDSTPDAFAFSPDTYSNHALSTYQTTEPVTITGIDTTASVSISSTGNSPDAKWAKGESPSDSDFTASSGTVVNNDKVRIKFRSSSVNAQTNTATLSVGGVSDTVSITTASATSGSSSGAATGGATYGLVVRNASGNIIFGPNSRAGHLVKTGTIALSYNGTPTDITAEGIVAGNEINILIDIGVISIGNNVPTITRVNASGGNSGYFRLTWNLGSNVSTSIRYWIIRY